MPERIEVEIKELVGREWVSPINVFRASSSATGVAESGATGAASGSLSLVDVPSSNLEMLRLINAEWHNREDNWVTVELRDGSVSGPRLAGPITINAQSRFVVKPDELLGRGALSGIDAVVISGNVSQGVVATVAWASEPLDIRE